MNDDQNKKPIQLGTQSITTGDATGIPAISSEPVLFDTGKPTVLETRTTPLTDTEWANKIAAEKVQVGQVGGDQGLKATDSTNLIIDDKKAPSEQAAVVAEPAAKVPVDETTAVANDNKPVSEEEVYNEFKQAVRKINLARIILGNSDEVDEIIANYQNKTGKLLAQSRDDKTIDPWIDTLDVFDQHGMNTIQHRLLDNIIHKLADKKQHLRSATGLGLDSIAPGKAFAPSPSGKPPVIRGRAAHLAIMSRMRGLRRAVLPNSGFYIAVRPPMLSELNEFVNTVKDEIKEYGRCLGGHFYLFTDVFCKEKFMEIFVSCIEDSNLEGWENPGVLMDCINIDDFDTCVWLLTSLMYRDGWPVDIMCTNTDCKLITSDHLIDLTNVRFLNWDIIPAQAKTIIGTMLSNNPKVTVEQVKQYQTQILGYTKKVRSENVEYELAVPSIGNFLKIGTELTGKLLSRIQGNDYSMHNDDVTTAIAYAIYRMFVPWIRQVNYLRPDKSIEFSTDDPDTIMDALESDHTINAAFNIQPMIEEFIGESKITYFCAVSLECPKCHKKPTGSVDDFYPLDMLSYFFYLAYQQLISIGTKQ